MNERTHGTGYRMVRTPVGSEVELMTEITSIVSDSRLDTTRQFGRLPKSHSRRRVLVEGNYLVPPTGSLRLSLDPKTGGLVVAQGLVARLEADVVFARQISNAYDWDRAPDWAHWAAVDLCGNAYWYAKRPVRFSHVWSAPGGRIMQIELLSEWLQTIDWRDTLCQRPEDV